MKSATKSTIKRIVKYTVIAYILLAVITCMIGVGYCILEIDKLKHHKKSEPDFAPTYSQTLLC